MESEGPSHRHPGVILFQVSQESEPSVKEMIFCTEWQSPIHLGPTDQNAYIQDSSASVSTPGYNFPLSQNTAYHSSPTLTHGVAVDFRNTPSRERLAQVSTPAVGSIASKKYPSLVQVAGEPSILNSSKPVSEPGIRAHREQTEAIIAHVQEISTSKAGTEAQALMSAEKYHAPPWSPLNQLRALPRAARTRNKAAK
jgi:hypothetical protein